MFRKGRAASAALARRPEQDRRLRGARETAGEGRRLADCVQGSLSTRGRRRGRREGKLTEIVQRRSLDSCLGMPLPRAQMVSAQGGLLPSCLKVWLCATAAKGHVARLRVTDQKAVQWYAEGML